LADVRRNGKETQAMKRAGDELLFAPLGGVGEIGMNLSIYGVGSERHRTWLVVDCGVAFGAEDQLPGVDLVMPDIRFLVEERHNVAGIVLTHAHEDHFGALVDLWPQLRVPVYATPFTAALLEAKRLSEAGAPEIAVTIVELRSRFMVGPFDVQLVSVAHSIPESNALIIRTSHGTVLHTGDWKLDPTPTLGPPTDEARLRALGEEGVLALIGDSTNAVREGRSPSESDVAHTLAELITSARGRVAVTTFASNVARIRATAEAAFAAGREVVVVGRAMDRIIQVARETGYLEGIGPFRSLDVYSQLAPNRVVALCTGSQGEPRAALARVAEDAHPEVSLGKGDRVIFSSRTIPGNEKAVGRIINGLIRQGVEVITDRTHLVHVSGHPRRAELEDMIRWVRPRIVIPVHGEALHLHEHAALARELSVPEVVCCENGDLVRLSPGRASIVDEVPAARLYKDGKLVVESGGRTIADRRRLGSAGLVSVAIAMTEEGEFAADPEIALTGIPERNTEGDLMVDVAHDAVVDTIRQLPRGRRRDPEAVRAAVAGAVRSALAASWGKKPVCHVHVLTL
jgi:ribonuclease J